MKIILFSIFSIVFFTFISAEIIFPKPFPSNTWVEDSKVNFTITVTDQTVGYMEVIKMTNSRKINFQLPLFRGF